MQVRKNRILSSWLIFVLILMAFAWRLYRLDYQSLRGDEAVSVLYASRGYGEMLRLASQIDVHPPLYYSLLYPWMMAVGEGEFAVRFLSLIFGLLSLPLVFILGRNLLSPEVGLVGAFMMAVNPFQIWFAQDARMYILSLTLTLASMLLFLKALKGERGYLWAAYTLVTILSLYSHYYGAFVLLAQGLFFLLWWPRHREMVAPWLLSQVVIGAALLPWLYLAFPNIVAYGGTGESVGFLTMVWRVLGAFSLGLTVEGWVRLLLSACFLPLLALGLWSTARRSWYTFAFLALYALVPIFGVFIASRQRSLFTERYLVAISPAYYLLLGGGLAWGKGVLSRKTGSVFFGAATLLILASSCYSLYGYHFLPQYAKSPDWRSLARYLRDSQREGDVVIQNHLDQAFLYYYRGPSPLVVLPRGSPPDLEETEKRLEEIVARYRRIWLLPDPVGYTDPTGFVERWLDRRCYPEGEATISSLRLKLYLPPTLFFAQIEHPLSFRLGEMVALIGYDLQEKEAHLNLTLYWQALAPLARGYTVFTHLLDGEGRIWGQKDNPPQGGSFPTTDWSAGDIIVDRYLIPLAPRTPPGRYQIEVGMYDPATGERLPVFDRQGEFVGDRVFLGEVEIGVGE